MSQCKLKKFLLGGVALAVFWAGSGCGSNNSGVPAGLPGATPSPSSASGTPASFAEVNQNVIQPRCVSCHNAGVSPAEVDLSSYAGVRAQVTPGNPGASTLFQQVSNGSMPAVGPKLVRASCRLVAG